jgi:hypothetical protein
MRVRVHVLRFVYYNPYCLVHGLLVLCSLGLFLHRDLSYNNLEVLPNPLFNQPTNAIDL